MPSPFPGMDPYLEHPYHWHDFHQSFMPAARAFLTPQLPSGYHVRVDENIYLHETASGDRRLAGRPDATVTFQPTGSTQRVATLTAEIEAPAYGEVPLVVDTLRDSYLTVVDTASRDVVTVLELLSPSNKYHGSDREQYEAKRRQLLGGATHFVELDLLRGGPRMPVKRLPDCDYYAMVSKAHRRPTVALWPIRLRDQLPAIPIPLRETDADIRLDLQAVLDRVYDQAAYATYIYLQTPSPLLQPLDAEWAQSLLKN